MKIKITSLMLCLVLLLSGCTAAGSDSFDITDGTENGTSESSESEAESESESTPAETEHEEKGEVTDLGDDKKTFGEDIESLGAYGGYFEGNSVDFKVEYISGTRNAFRLDGTTLHFTSITEDTVYSISGTFRGNIVIDAGNGHKFELELCGFSIVCNSANPITVISGDEVTVKAKKDTKNYIYDMRAAIDSANSNAYSGAIHSEVDLEIGGKGELFVVSENNNGIHSKDDLKVKNLTLFVACTDNALKGNDSVKLEGGTTTLIASAGDGIKTSKSDVSDKNNQRGTVSITGGCHSVYAACDGIDAAYDVVIDDSATVLNIYTDKYSSYSKEVTANASDVNYIRFTSNQYYYSVKYYNSATDYVWVNAEYHSKVSGGRTTYYYYSYPKMPEYSKQQFFIYQSESDLGQESKYLAKSEYLTPNSGCDTLALTQSFNGISIQWTNYTTTVQDNGWGGGFPGGGPGGGGGFPGGGGGFGEGNSDKGDYSTKGIKAANEIVINAGTVNVKAYDDAIHVSNDTALESGASPLGNVTVNGGNITLYSNDDGIHADGSLSINAGTVTVTNAYEGLEGTQVSISGGFVSIYSTDDGINATTQTGTAISISGGNLYIYCTGDGIDSNSRTADVGIVITGGRTVVITNSGMNSALDTENGYTYKSGQVIAIMSSGGMSSESTHCDNFSSIGKSIKTSLTAGKYFVAEIGDVTATVKMPLSLSATVIILGDNSPTTSTESSTSETLDENGVAWR